MPMVTISSTTSSSWAIATLGAMAAPGSAAATASDTAVRRILRLMLQSSGLIAPFCALPRFFVTMLFPLRADSLMQLVLYIKNRTYIEQCNAIVFIARFGLRLCRDGNKGLYQRSSGGDLTVGCCRRYATNGLNRPEIVTVRSGIESSAHSAGRIHRSPSCRFVERSVHCPATAVDRGNNRSPITGNTRSARYRR